MTVKEAAEKSGLTTARVYQFCRKYKISPRNITEGQYIFLVTRKHFIGVSGNENNE